MIRTPLEALEKVREAHSPTHARILAEAFVCTQADESSYWFEEIAAILRYAQRAQGHSCHAYLQGILFLDYEQDHHGRLRWAPEVIRHGAREFLGE